MLERIPLHRLCTPEEVAAAVVYLASPQCRFTGRVFGIEGDDLYLFDGWSAEHHFNNASRQWSVESLADALGEMDRQDRGWMIAPSTRLPGPSPTDETLAALEKASVRGG